MEGQYEDMRRQLKDLGISSGNIDEIELIMKFFAAVNGVKEAECHESDLDLERHS